MDEKYPRTSLPAAEMQAHGRIFVCEKWVEIGPNNVVHVCCGKDGLLSQQHRPPFTYVALLSTILLAMRHLCGGAFVGLTGTM